MDEIEKELINKIKYLINKKKNTIGELCNILDISENELNVLIELMIKNGVSVYIDNDKVKLANMKNEFKKIKVDLDENHLKFLSLSDTHLGSVSDCVAYLDYAYEYGEKNNVQLFFHAGDLTDGKKGREQDKYLKFNNIDDQIDYVCKIYPKTSIKTYLVGGNHDYWWRDLTGRDVIREIANRLYNLEYLNTNNALIELGNLRVNLLHGDGIAGSNYMSAFSSYIKLFSKNNKPNMIINGHTHIGLHTRLCEVEILQNPALISFLPYASSYNNSSIFQPGFNLGEVWFNNDGDILEIDVKRVNIDKTKRFVLK